MKAPVRHYWDAQAFGGWLGGNKKQAEVCRNVLEAAQNGEVQLVTSALSLVQIVKPIGESGLEDEKLDTLQRFFLNSFILIRPLDRETAQLAQKLLLEHPALHLEQAIHAATALNGGIRILETFDPGLLALHNQIGQPPLIIRLPYLSRQIPLF